MAPNLRRMVAGLPAVGREADQQVLGGDVLVAQFLRLLAGRGEHAEQRPGHVRGAHGRPGGLGQPGELVLGLREHGGGVGADRTQQRRRRAALLPDQGGEQVQGVHVRIALSGGPPDRVGECFLAPAGEFVFH